MRTETEMISLIKDIAFKEENIRAAFQKIFTGRNV